MIVMARCTVPLILLMTSLEVPDCHCTYFLLLDLLFFEVLQYITGTLKKGISTRYLPVESIGWGATVILAWNRHGATMMLAWGGMERERTWGDMERTWGGMERTWGGNDAGLGRHETDMGRHGTGTDMGRHGTGTDLGRQCCGFEADSPGLRLHNVMCFLTVCRFTSNHQQLHRCVSERVATLHM